MITPRTVPIAALRALIAACDDTGFDVVSPLAASGLRFSRHEIESGLVDEISRSSFTRFTYLSVSQFHQDACSRYGTPPFHLSYLKPLYLCLIACPSLELAIDAAVDFLRMVRGEVERFELVIERDTARLVLTRPCKTLWADQFVALYGLAHFYRVFGWLIGERIPLVRVGLVGRARQTPSVFCTLFQHSIDFDAPLNYVEFPAYYLKRPIIRGYADLKEIPPLFAFDLFSFEYEKQPLHTSVVSAIEAALSAGEQLPNLGQTSEMFGMSVASFRRRLADEGTSFVTIRQECRQRLAIKLLSETEMSVEAIGDILQFSEAAGFRRAFRDATGLNPSHYRRSALGNRSQ